MNASGTVQIDKLYISVTLGDYRNNTDSRPGAFSPWRYVFLSAPKNNTPQACLYIFEPVPDAKEGDELNGCSGVLSEQCIDYLERKLQVTNTTILPNGWVGCPLFDFGSSDFRSACGSKSPTGFLRFANRTSDYTSPPKGMELDLPSDYETFGLYGVKPSLYDTTPDNFTYYERYAKQPVPFVVSEVNRGRAQTKVFCVAPDKATSGSHKLEDTESMGTQMEWRTASWMTVWTVFLVAVLLV